MAAATCTHLSQIHKVTPSAKGCEECLNGRHLGSSSLMRNLRPCWLLRQFQEQARNQALPFDESPHHQVLRARGKLAVVLHRSALHGVVSLPRESARPHLSPLHLQWLHSAEGDLCPRLQTHVRKPLRPPCRKCRLPLKATAFCIR